MKRESIDGDDLFVIHDFMSSEDCQRHIQHSEEVGFETFSIDGEVFHGYRNNARAMFEDPALADTLWAVASTWMPATIDGKSPCGLDPRFRYYRYTGREAFAPHYDGSAQIGDWSSKLTFLVYLSDVGKGGETRFYGDDLKVRFTIRPQRGKALVFKHAILHEGVAVDEGTKYVLRTDVMYG